EELTLADTYVAQGVAALERDDPARAVLWFAHAARLSGDDPERERANRVRARAAIREAPLPVYVFPHAAHAVTLLAFHPAARPLAVVDRQRAALGSGLGARPRAAAGVARGRNAGQCRGLGAGRRLAGARHSRGRRRNPRLSRGRTETPPPDPGASRSPRRQP